MKTLCALVVAFAFVGGSMAYAVDNATAPTTRDMTTQTEKAPVYPKASTSAPACPPPRVEAQPAACPPVCTPCVQACPQEKVTSCHRSCKKVMETKCKDVQKTVSVPDPCNPCCMHNEKVTVKECKEVPKKVCEATGYRGVKAVGHASEESRAAAPAGNTGVPFGIYAYQ